MTWLRQIPPAGDCPVGHRPSWSQAQLVTGPLRHRSTSSQAKIAATGPVTKWHALAGLWWSRSVTYWACDQLGLWPTGPVTNWACDEVTWACDQLGLWPTGPVTKWHGPVTNWACDQLGLWRSDIDQLGLWPTGPVTKWHASHGVSGNQNQNRRPRGGRLNH